MVALTVEWAEEKAKSVGTNRGTDGTSEERVRSWLGAAPAPGLQEDLPETHACITIPQLPYAGATAYRLTIG